MVFHDQKAPRNTIGSIRVAQHQGADLIRIKTVSIVTVIASVLMYFIDSQLILKGDLPSMVDEVAREVYVISTETPVVHVPSITI